MWGVWSLESLKPTALSVVGGMLDLASHGVAHACRFLETLLLSLNECQLETCPRYTYQRYA